jgi:hypothetical protein
MKLLILNLILFATCGISFSQQAPKVVALYTAKNDLAHISFVNEALPWFEKKAKENGFEFSSTSDWAEMNAENLSNYHVIVFLDTRPEIKEQRTAFENHMKNGGAWIDFHFSAFALSPSDFP